MRSAALLSSNAPLRQLIPAAIHMKYEHSARLLQLIGLKPHTQLTLPCPDFKAARVFEGCVQEIRRFDEHIKVVNERHKAISKAAEP